MSAWFEAATGLVPLQPWCGALALLLLVPLVLGWWRWRRGDVRGPAFAPGVLLADAPLPTSWRARLRFLPTWLGAVALLLAIAAAMRPVQRIELPAVRAGIDIVLCLDVSSSMAQRDLDAGRDRLEVARSAAAAFVAARPDDRIGLVRFARFPDLVCPPTLDHAALTQLLGEQQLVARDGAEDATGIGAAVARAVQVLARAPTPSRVVILATDGEENVAAAGTPDEIGPLQAAQLAARHGVKVHALAVGGGPDAAPAIDTTQIEQLASRTGGRFFAARDAAGFAAVYAAIDALERTPFAAPRYRVEERYRPFAGAALLLLLAAAVLRRTWCEVLA